MVSEILCDFREEGSGSIPMTEVGEDLPELFPFMEKSYSASEVSNAKNRFEKKVCRAGTTFLYALKKGCFQEDKLQELIRDIATGLEEIKGVLDEDLDDEFIDKLPGDLKRVLEEVRDIEKGEDITLDSPLFGEFVEGELGENWVEKVDSDEFGEISVELFFNRIISQDDILVPSALKENEKFLDLDHGYGYWENGKYIERYAIELID